jgi:hypothetical protein
MSDSEFNSGFQGTRNDADLVVDNVSGLSTIHVASMTQLFDLYSLRLAGAKVR